MLTDILIAIPYGFLLAFMIGPVFFALLETSAIKGFRAAIAFDLGVILADIIFLLAAYFMTASILEKLKDDPGLYIFGGSILTLYGIITFIITKTTYLKEVDMTVVEVKKNNYPQLFIKGFLINFINIGVLGIWLGMIVVISPQLDNDENRIFTFFITVLLSYFSIDLGKILLAKSLNRYLTPLRIFWLKRLIAIIMGVCGIVLIVKGVFPHATDELTEEIYAIPDNEPVESQLEIVE